MQIHYCIHRATGIFRAYSLPTLTVIATHHHQPPCDTLILAPFSLSINRLLPPPPLEHFSSSSRCVFFCFSNLHLANYVRLWIIRQECTIAKPPLSRVCWIKEKKKNYIHGRARLFIWRLRGEQETWIPQGSRGMSSSLLLLLSVR